MHGQQRKSPISLSRPHMVSLHSVRFTYPGWERDYTEAEQLHDDYQILFDRFFIGAMKRKQTFHDGYTVGLIRSWYHSIL
jgi:hypothetical protein